MSIDVIFLRKNLLAVFCLNVTFIFEILNEHSIPSKCYILRSKVRYIVSSVISAGQFSSSPAGGSHGRGCILENRGSAVLHKHQKSCRIYLVTMVISI